MMHTVVELLRNATRALERGSDSARLDAELLLGNLLGVPRSALIAHGGHPVAPDREAAYAGLIERRLRGAPVAYLTGSREFWSLPLKVSPAVLVPRPETELLVELALERLAPDSAGSVLDLGTGSGAIALALASERPAARILAVDVSAPALEVARDNAAALRVSNVEWRMGSWFETVAGERFDLVVANPPYVAADDPALVDLGAEPHIALSPGPTGLEALAVIADGAARHLTAGGWMLLEHGDGQAREVRALLEHNGFGGVCTHDDLSGRPRVTLGRL
jgi:release factor glutamine methyltransferase